MPVHGLSLFTGSHAPCTEEMVDEETFNLTIRRFLKTFGVTAQREIEKAVREALADGRLRGDERLEVRATLVLDGVGADVVVEGEIALESGG